jgi:Methyltransferase domain
VNLASALELEGWMNDAELLWLAEQASAHHTILEVGSWKGRSTRALADNTQGTVYAVDLWDWRPAGWMDPATYTKAMLQKRTDDYIFRIFCNNLSPHIDTGKVWPIRNTSLAAAQDLDLEFDLIFIDAAHDYESVVQDIGAWRKKLSADGMLCGHDYSQHWPDVVKAVDELVPDRKLAPETAIWYVL